MREHYLIQHFSTCNANISLIEGEIAITYRELADAVLAQHEDFRKTGIRPSDTVHFKSAYSIASFVALFALYVNGNIVMPDPGKLPAILNPFFKWQYDGQLKLLRKKHLPDPKFDRLANAPGLILTTSGTSGTPKYSLLNFDLLFKDYLAREAKHFKTVMALSFDHFGGMDVYMRAISAGGTIVLPSKIGPAEVFSLIEKHKADFLAATPSFFKLALLSGAVPDFDLTSLKRINLGAEKSSQKLSAALCEIFPNAAIKETFATTECGVIASKPAGDSFQGRNKMKVEKGQLLVKTQNAFAGYVFKDNEDGPGPSEFIPSGDSAYLSDNNGIVISGRKDRIINTGGEKVQAEHIEEMLLQLKEVQDIQVYAEAHALLGQMVCARVVSGYPAIEVKKAIRKWGQKHLQQHEIPVKILLTEKIEFTARFKRKNQ